MPESAAEPTPTPYISPEEDKDNAGRLKPDVAYQVHHDIRQQAERWGLKINPDDSPIKKRLKHFALSKVFGLFSSFTLPEYQASQIVAVEKKAARDPLTGLLNRRAFEEKVRQKLSQGAAGLVIMIDADHFKKVNDSFGHNIGDQVLRRIAFGLQSNLDLTKDILGRYGGEEFVAFLEIKNLEIETNKIYEIVERIRSRTIEYLNKIKYEDFPEGKKPEDDKIPVTLSFGATITCGEPWEQAVKKADENLYQAKNSGRDQSFGDDGKITLTPLPGDPPKIVSN